MAISLANRCSPTRLGLPMDEKGPQKQSMWHRLGLRRWLGRDDRDRDTRENQNRDVLPFPHNLNHNRASSTDSAKHDNITRRLSRRVGVTLPKASTFKRPVSEQGHLAPQDHEHRRAQSADRRPLSAQRTRSPPPAVGPRLSAPEVQWLGPTPATTVDDPLKTNILNETETDSEPEDWDSSPDVTPAPKDPLPDTLEMELEHRWILNLSMHFRDRSEREKFFVTYAETPNRWRRVTISCDYRAAPPDSLEQDLKELRYQRDKCARIYESIRESLPEIQFYDTVTNLKVETRDGRLHVHVTEDVNETIPYPPISSIGHLRGAQCVPENFLHFENHLSGFVYKVRLGGHEYIKKEIPGPDTVDEFLYEINALHALDGAPNVIRVEAIVVDDRQEVVKGLLINYATQGALVDLLYDQRGRIPFARRERWAKQIVQGLCEIHESGYVQGDFTLSNIVVDGDDNAHIIDINRRGCPVGWEPPEIAAKIESNQRISMYIGVKTDLYQLGMTLWALAMEEDEPERQPRPLLFGNDIDIPDYYRRVVDICLSPTPRHRLSAKDLLGFFPPDLLTRPLPAGRDRYNVDHDLRSLVTKGNGVDPVPITHAFNQVSHPFDPEFSKPHDHSLSHHMFSAHPAQGKGSTPTLAGSNGGAAFLSRHSSTSTLNHHEHDDRLAPSWDIPQYDPRAGRLPDHSSWVSHENDRNSLALEQQSFPSISVPSLGQPSIDQDSVSGNGSSRHLDNKASVAFDDKTLLPTLHDEQISEYVETGDESEPQRHDHAGAVPFLFHSILPINPALPISRRRTFPAVAQDTISPFPHDAETSVLDPPTLMESLSESQLPINPALKEESYILISETSRNDLLESRLPINPAIADNIARFVQPPIESDTCISPPLEKKQPLERVHFLLPRKPVSKTFMKNESIIKVSSLLESRLPISPAVEDGPVRVTSSSSTINLPLDQTIEEPVNSVSCLLQSALPISPAVDDGPVHITSSPPKIQLPLNDGVEEPFNSVSSLLQSALPISPAVEDGPVHITASSTVPLPLNQVVEEPVTPVSCLLRSELPINPASRVRV
ncbi:uncharacterized protein N7483_003915 [Penicillium malachiteum]|uniref:uncharacterized protein n=1 Tax=Penicillium malachiteum TaxID=1324776 RepID=UPI0025477143|nr:uncharacterized protein N7483_003915 [Penicillium malachiteum]KAJ5729407.1 hypothetical protein N7483_003915 [Penicillium malachiteum]